MAGTEGGELRKHIYIDAPPESVFPFLIDPTLLVRWLGQRAEADPRPQGHFLVDMNERDVIRGEYLEIEAPRRVVFSWGWDREGAEIPPGSTTVEITLEPEGGGTRLTLIHRDLPDDVREEHAAGWDHYMQRLQVAGAGGDAGPDPLATRDIVHGAPGSLPSDVIGKDRDEEEGDGQ